MIKFLMIFIILFFEQQNQISVKKQANHQQQYSNKN